MTEESENPPHRRRKRYQGTHPHRFEERYKELDPKAYPEMQAHVRAQGRTPAGTHVPILVKDVMDLLAPAPGETVADGTLGYGGHALEFLRRIGPAGLLVGFDLDKNQLERTRVRLAEAGFEKNLHLCHGNFAGLGKPLAALSRDGYDVIFADLGVSSMQVDDPERGFSYKVDGPLDMRMDGRLRRTAADLLATLTFDELDAALLNLADEEEHRAVARAIVAARARGPLTRTLELADLVMAAKGISRQRWKWMREAGEGHPAAQTFQALRILVNDELASLASLLRLAPYCLRPGGRIGILSFHSGEDRLVKKSFREGLETGLYAAISEEVVRPTAEECRDNPRAAPAKFRWAKKAGGSVNP